MSVGVWIVSFTLLGGVLSALAGSVILLSGDRLRAKALPHLVSFAIGTLLGAAFLGLIPHAVMEARMENVHRVGLTLVLGLLSFFVLEKLVLWRHCHHGACEAHTPDEHRDRAAGVMILIGDAVHNMVDGVLIAAAFMTDIHLGIATSVAVIAHEVPQEIGDIAVLLKGGFSRARAFLANILVSLTSVITAVLAWLWMEQVDSVRPYILAVAAASFIYVAVADLIPGLHRRVDVRGGAVQLTFICAGLLVIWLTHSAAH